MNFNQFKKFFILFVSILFVSAILYVSYFYKNQKQKNYQSKKNLFDSLSFNFVQKLAYRGMEQFQKGLSEGNTQYKLIYEADSQLFIEFVTQGTLKTASSPLIQGTIDFISECLNRNIHLYINEKHMFSTSENLLKNCKESVLDLKIRNQDNVHFFVNYYNDTIGDGYCFFHALDNVLKNIIPNWQEKIFI
ncbi:hypothetical protein C6B37_01185 [Candidatus Phytoplasma phoenicium]|uniref:Uncharacterized protein n=1 Tax=Candidatus Phytoplasma phoenicium TaxID=198422 RepID=A0A2S8NUW3_9MOLU|nr:hypothetical protein C6B37_01185 [Candidatus Phytoplasma phoenicium]